RCRTRRVRRDLLRSLWPWALAPHPSSPHPSVVVIGAGGTPALRSEPELLIHQDRRDSAGSDRLVDNQEVIYSAGNAVGLPGPQVLKRKAVLVDASQSGVEIGDNLLTTDNKYDVARSGDDWTELAPAGRRDQK